jgi:hypothetical protein
MFVRGRVTDLKGKPLADVPVDVWRADNDGYYGRNGRPTGRGTIVAGAVRHRRGWKVLLQDHPAVQLSDPDRWPGRRDIRRPGATRCARPCAFLVKRRATAADHPSIDGDKYLDTDVVFGVKNELIAKVEKRTDPMTPDGKPAAVPWHLMTYDFRMKPGAGAAPKPMMAETEDA